MRYLVIILCCLVIASCGTKLSCDTKEVKELVIEVHENLIKSLFLTEVLYKGSNVKVLEPVISFASSAKVYSMNKDPKILEQLTEAEDMYIPSNIAIENIIQNADKQHCNCKASLILKSMNLSYPIKYKVEKTTDGKIVVTGL